MRFVHDHCLQQWRMSSVNPTHFYQCDICKYRYSFKRTWIVKLLQCELVLYFSTTICFFLTSLLLGILSVHIMGIDVSKLTIQQTWSFYAIYHMIFGAVCLACCGFISLLCSGLFFVLCNAPVYYGQPSKNTIGIFIILFLLLGVANILYNMYKIISSLTKYILSKVEYHIENV
jgi:hypothetical protein